MLHTPIATTTGQMEEFNINTLKKEIKNTVKNTTTDDAIAVYDAIEIAMPNINPPKEGPDAQKNDAKQELREKNLTLYDVFKISSSWDSISYEWTKGFNISFEGYNLLNKYYKQYNNINLATTKTFLNILSNYPDTLIARKKDENTSKMVSNKAKEVLNNFNEESLLKFDKFLSNEGNKLNPGTTADLIASSLMIFLLDRINNKNTVLW
jgi:triphosphoribosyl-dephospho-CoA synthase